MADHVGPPDVTELGREAEVMIRALAVIGSENGHLTRLYLTPQHRLAADLVGRWMTQVGLVVSEDALGTVKGRLEQAGGATNFSRRLLIGSHIDTVNDAGAYDGTLGVIAGILAVREIIRRRGPMPFGIDMLAFGDEEGSRFPATLLCSQAVAGHFDPASLAVESVDGVRLEEALRRYGKDPALIREAAYDKDEVAAYVEVHIEQGPVLEQQDEALGVVTAIASQSRHTVTVVGEAGHAGTVPMGLRRDALAATAEMALAIESLALRHADDFMVATIGKLNTWPGASNVIPGRTVFTVDLRAQTDLARREAVAWLGDEIMAIAKRRGVTAWVERTHEADARPCDPVLQAGFAGAIIRQSGKAVHLPSGAGHDGQAIGALCPIGMLFVRCRGGISHSPAEFTSVKDMGQAIAALIDFIENFDPTKVPD
jgi:allantoate deiminase